MNDPDLIALFGVTTPVRIRKDPVRRRWLLVFRCPFCHDFHCLLGNDLAERPKLGRRYVPCRIPRRRVFLVRPPAPKRSSSKDANDGTA